MTQRSDRAAREQARRDAAERAALEPDEGERHMRDIERRVGVTIGEPLRSILRALGDADFDPAGEARRLAEETEDS